MDAGPGSPQHTLTALFAEAAEFDFYQLVWLLSRFAATDRRSVSAGEPEREVVRFRANLSAAFAPSDVHELTVGDDGAAPRMTVNFLGIANPAAVGALPSWYASLARSLEAGFIPGWWQDGGSTRIDPRPELRAFFEVFDDRLVGLMFRAWRRHFLPAQLEDAGNAGAGDRRRLPGGGWAFAAMLAVLGIYTEHQRDRLHVDVRTLVRHAGSLGRRPVTPGALVDLIHDYFDVAAEVLPFTATPIVLPATAQLRLDPAAGFALGTTTLLGARVLLEQSEFRVRLGPLDLATFRSFLPRSQHTAAGNRHRALFELIRFAVGPEFDFVVQLALRSDDVPPLQFDSGRSGAMLLGWSTWLGLRPEGADADDTLISVSTLERHSDEPQSQESGRQAD